MKPVWRLIKSGYHDAYTNMAIDESLFLGVAQGGAPATLRIYGWKPAAFSLGYGQDPAVTLDLDACRRQGIDFVRRITAGGALLHSSEVTYSLVCTKQDIGITDSVVNSFKIISSFILRAYRSLGLHPQFAVEAPSVRDKESLGGRQGFCFAGKEKYDILINGRKLGGNAQKRQKAIIFQHGSIPLRSETQRALDLLRQKPSGLNDSVCSLAQALGREADFKEIQDVLVSSFTATFGIGLREESFTPQEIQRSHDLKVHKYATPEWNLYGNKTIRPEKAPVA